MKHALNGYLFKRATMFMKLLPDDDTKQRLRVIRILQAIGGGLIQSIAALILFFAGGFRLSAMDFLILMGSLWVGNVAFYLLIRSGVNQRFSDPSMTLAQLVWAIFCTLSILFFMVKFRFRMLPFLFMGRNRYLLKY